MKISADQNTIEFGTFTVHFYEEKKEKRRACLKCYLLRTVANCEGIPCQAEERKDGKNGVFSIRQEPTIKPVST